MHAAVVTTFDRPPHYTEFRDPQPSGPQEVLIDVIAAGLHPRVRSQADGSHYTSTDELPLVPGIDGVGRTADGELRYFVLPDTPMGAMAEHGTATHGVLVTTSWLSDRSRQRARAQRIVTFEGTNLIYLMEKYLDLKVVISTRPPSRGR